MSLLQGVGLFLGVYLLLVGRNAWKQGEFRQFSFSLGVVLALGAAMAAIVLLYDRLVGG